MPKALQPLEELSTVSSVLRREAFTELQGRLLELDPEKREVVLPRIMAGPDRARGRYGYRRVRR